ncbi:hypothetical protein GHT06_017315 [Daphnia sinensis]|uniref:Uncharacterized protein n=1 Tax=Daphnia sinensis TaxID=1820382 RepID=A0AAD5KPP6_9CRUS|nr:hypothetical protein GHT06_017315 [Daphnia sinensis]
MSFRCLVHVIQTHTKNVDNFHLIRNHVPFFFSVCHGTKIYYVSEIIVLSGKTKAAFLVCLKFHFPFHMFCGYSAFKTETAFDTNSNVFPGAEKPYNRIRSMNKMTSWTTLLLYGFLCWAATTLVFCSEDCNQSLEFPADHGCTCTGLVLTNCMKEKLKVDVSKLYRLTPLKHMIAIRNSTGIILYNDEDDLVLNDMREVSLIVSNVTKLTINEKTFDRIVINVVFDNVPKLNLAERSFSSCWGTAWILKHSVPASIQSAFSSSDMVVYKDTDSSYIIHARPRATPRQRIKLVYQLAAEVNDLKITIYAVLALLGAIVLTLIGLTIVVARIASPTTTSSFVPLPDVVPVPPNLPIRTRTKNPVTKVSRISRTFLGKGNAGKKANTNAAKHHHHMKNPRPPIPLPPHSFESC